jgi:hypothetical protein
MIYRHTQWEQNGTDIKYDVSDCIVRSFKAIGQFDIIHNEHQEELTRPGHLNF